MSRNPLDRPLVQELCTVDPNPMQLVGANHNQNFEVPNLSQEHTDEETRQWTEPFQQSSLRDSQSLENEHRFCTKRTGEEAIRNTPPKKLRLCTHLNF